MIQSVFSGNGTQQMLEAGFQSLSYRLRTELAVEAWHWNPEGTWSDPKNRCGYWTSNTENTSKEGIRMSYGYKLPRRGTTLDEANNDGYSRLDDGNHGTFWKSNPYLDSFANPILKTEKPQWIGVIFDRPTEINALRIHWAAPFAKKITVEWSNDQEASFFGASPPKVWRAFKSGTFTHLSGDARLLTLAPKPVKATFLRIHLSESSHTSLTPESSDPRDYAGFAIREIEVGRIEADGKFIDAIQHRPHRTQTLTYASSTDPWHTEADLDKQTTQPGIDLVFQSGLHRNQPVMIPLPVLFDTPENSKALVSYLQKKNHPYSRLEMGEEPDGQRVDPRDYADLYCTHAEAIRSVDPHTPLGGPSFVTIKTTGYDHGQWVRALLAGLKEHHQEKELQFISFEWYPFDKGYEAPQPKLLRAKSLLQNAVKVLRSAGADCPIVIGEYGFSAFACQPLVDLPGALFNTEVACEFLSLGGGTSFLYGYEPGQIQNDWATNQDSDWGDGIMFLRNPDPEGKPVELATFHAARLLTREWTLPEGGTHQLFKTNSQNEDISIYPIKRPDAKWAFLILNKNGKKNVTVRIKLPETQASSENWHWFTYGPDQYHWKANKEQGRPDRNNPPEHKWVARSENSIQMSLPPWSINVLRAP